MKKKIIFLFFSLVLGGCIVSAQNLSTFQKEVLNRGVVALPSENGGQFVSWRMLDTDPLSTTFDLLRDGRPIVENCQQNQLS